QTLSAKGKPAKVVITAVMRKLIVLSNILIAAGRKWVPKTA
ncbi:MAG: IS110 family transposase, partial [Phaeovulum sp.]|nr:IS110 family transposase [Phaeovulum sp.]